MGFAGLVSNPAIEAPRAEVLDNTVGSLFVERDLTSSTDTKAAGEERTKRSPPSELLVRPNGKP
jgi:hypothetical protein